MNKCFLQMDKYLAKTGKCFATIGKRILQTDKCLCYDRQKDFANGQVLCYERQKDLHERASAAPYYKNSYLPAATPPQFSAILPQKNYPHSAKRPARDGCAPPHPNKKTSRPWPPFPN